MYLEALEGQLMGLIDRGNFCTSRSRIRYSLFFSIDLKIVPNVIEAKAIDRLLVYCTYGKLNHLQIELVETSYKTRYSAKRRSDVLQVIIC